MLTFFVPTAEDAEQAKQVYEAVRKFMGEQASGPLDDRRIFSLHYRHDGQRYYAELGKPDERNKEAIIAILKQKEYPRYFVCTPNGGVVRGGPILVGENEVLGCIDFDPE